MEDAAPVNPRTPNDVDRAVGLRIAALRKRMGMSQDTLGAALGVTYQQVQKYEKGRNRIGAGRLREVARALVVPVSDLLDDPVDRHPSDVLVLLAETGAVDVLQAFATIEDAALRQDVLALVRSAVRIGRTAD